MKYVTKVVGAVLIVTALGSTAQSLSTSAAENTETQALRSQVRELQIRLDALEAKVETMGTPRMYKTSP